MSKIAENLSHHKLFVCFGLLAVNDMWSIELIGPGQLSAGSLEARRPFTDSHCSPDCLVTDSNPNPVEYSSFSALS